MSNDIQDLNIDELDSVNGGTGSFADVVCEGLYTGPWDGPGEGRHRSLQQPGEVRPNLKLRPVAPQILTRPPQLGGLLFLDDRHRHW